MKKSAIYFFSVFIILFTVLYAAAYFTGTGEKKSFSKGDPLKGEASGVWIKPFTSNPEVRKAGDYYTFLSGPATANPLFNAEAKSSKDCVACHLNVSLVYHLSDHMKGSVKKEDLKDPSCGKCHNPETFEGSGFDSQAFLKSVVPSKILEKTGDSIPVACISCHGSNGKHYEKFSLTAEGCGSCHDLPKNCEGFNKNPLAGDIVKNFKASPHYSSATSEKFLKKAKEEGLMAQGGNKEFYPNSLNCLSCHQNASFREYFAETEYYKDAEGNKYFAAFADNNSSAFTKEGSPKEASGLTLAGSESSETGLACATCHDVHGGSFTRKETKTLKDSFGNRVTKETTEVYEAPNGAPIREQRFEAVPEPVTVFSAEFNLCVQCHAVSLDYLWDKENNRFDYFLKRSVHDNTEGMKDIDNMEDKTAKVTDGKISFAKANVFDYKSLQGKHVSYEGGDDEPVFKNQPWRMPLKTGSTIIDTHFKGVIVSEVAEGEDGKTYILKREKVAGYNINAASKRACTMCHDEHLASKFGKIDRTLPVDYEFTEDGFKEGSLTLSRINKKVVNIAETWAKSKHGAYKDEQFNKDDFEARCMKCHSGYENAKFLEGITDVSKLDNSSSSLYGSAGEAVSCITCHDLRERNKEGNIELKEARKWKRSSLPFTWSKEPYFDPAKDELTKEALKKIGSSAQCFTCHDGDTSNKLIAWWGDNDESFQEAFKRKALAHNGGAGAVYWGAAAYEFPGKTYSGGNFPQHAVNMGKKDGSFLTPEEAAAKEKTYIYACADCHDFNGGSHSSQSVVKDDEGRITGIRMTKNKTRLGCGEENCHGEDGLHHANKAQANRQSYLKALEEVSEAFEKKFDLRIDPENKRITYAGNKNKDFVSWGSGEEARKLYGAAANLFLLKTLDKGAYSHNPVYVKQILWDAMDFAGGSFSKEARFFVNDVRP